MKLLIDIGNTRIKWALSNDGDLLAPRAVGWTEDGAAAIDTLALSLPDGLDGVVGASVGDPALVTALSSRLEADLGRKPRWLAVQREQLGVRCGYQDTERLGVDRWLAALAGYHRAPAAALIAQVGTAATIDGVTADGQHLGGMILPGLNLMADALFGNTARIRAPASALKDPTDRMEFFADDTDTAVQNGCLLAVTAAIESSLTAMEAAGHATTVYLAGGAAPGVAQQLHIDVEHVPSLVLEGIQRVAEAVD